MSKEAEEIEKARKLYAAALGTPLEKAAKDHLKDVVSQVRRATK